MATTLHLIIYPVKDWVKKGYACCKKWAGFRSAVTENQDILVFYSIKDLRNVFQRLHARADNDISHFRPSDKDVTIPSLNFSSPLGECQDSRAWKGLSPTTTRCSVSNSSPPETRQNQISDTEFISPGNK